MARSRDSGGWVVLLILPALFLIFIIINKIRESISESAERRARQIVEQQKKEIDRYGYSVRRDAEKYAVELKEKACKYLSRKQSEAEEIHSYANSMLDMQEAMFKEKTKGFPWVAKYYSDLIIEQGMMFAEILETKKNPSIKGAESVKMFSRIAADAKKEKMILKGITEYYESLFPWLIDFREAPDELISQDKKDDIKENEDPASRFLSGAEWENLSDTEKYQKSLERYWKRKKSNWEIGRDFERFIGYEYEVQGWDVVYFGAVKGFEDLGRDVIAKNKKEVHIVQCKYWASDKIIHEKHLFQLFGTSVVYKIENNLKSYPKSVFVTSCSLSDTAKDVAKALNIEVVERKKMTQFPCVKCNVGNSGEKIYHLPFDQQYDKIKIEKHKGEIYCATIAEAEEAGFRRAFRWKGNKT